MIRGSALSLSQHPADASVIQEWLTGLMGPRGWSPLLERWVDMASRAAPAAPTAPTRLPTPLAPRRPGTGMCEDSYPCHSLRLQTPLALHPPSPGTARCGAQPTGLVCSPAEEEGEDATSFLAGHLQVCCDGPSGGGPGGPLLCILERPPAARPELGRSVLTARGELVLPGGKT